MGLTCLDKLSEKHAVNFVFTDKGSEGILDRCTERNIPLYTGNPRNGKATQFLADKQCDLLLSINYLFVVEEDVIQHPRLYAINFHGSLLPKYRGRTPHVWAIINGEQETGITAHLMSKGCDEGDIVCQERIAIGADVTGGDVLSIFLKKYPVIIEKVIDSVKTGTVRPLRQNHEKATCFGKRTPEDGLIHWSWQRQQIYNWVRALARPYPGAFTFLKDKKITIHRVEFSDTGFHADTPDGTILAAGENIDVKTPNGAIRLIDFELSEPITITNGMLFHARH